MLSTLDLLSLSPEEAMLAILQHEMKPGFDVAKLTIGPPISDGGTATHVLISIDKGKVPLEYWAFDEPFDFQYERLDLAGTFADLGLSVTSPLPTTRLALIETLFLKSGIFFDPSEFVDGEVTTDTEFTIEADVSSRWVGSVNVSVVRKVDSLSDSVTVTNLYDALKYNTNISVQSGPGAVRLITALIAANNLELPTQVNLEDYEFSEVTELNQRDDISNTSVKITILNSDRYSGSVVVTFRRLNLSKISDYSNVVIYSRVEVSTISLGLKVADQLNIYMAAEDLLEDPLPYLTIDQQADVSIFAHGDSLLYISELTVEWHKGEMDA